MKDPSQRYGLLDIARLAFALVVVIFHYGYFGPSLGLTPHNVGPEWLKYGRFGVHIFFAVSGFVIMLSVGNRTRRQFLWARFLRLWPAIVISASITFLITNLIGSNPASTFKGYLYAIALLPLSVSPLGLDWSYWSLLYEIRFYLAVAILLPLLRTAKSIFVISAVWLALSYISLVFSVLGPFVMAPYSGFFILGIGLYVWKSSVQYGLYLFLAALPLCVLQIVEENHLQHEIVRVDSGEAIVIVCAIAIILLLATSRWPIRAAVAGAISYPLYLVHQFAGYAVMQQFSASYSQAVGIALALGVAWGITLVEGRIRSILARSQLKRVFAGTA